MSPDNLAHYPSLVDKTILITGGGSGIGGAMSVLFAEQDCGVVLLDIADEPSRQLVDGDLQHREAGIAISVATSPTSTALQRTIHAVEAAHGDVDVLINNAARDDRQDLMTATLEYWDRAIAVNLGITCSPCRLSCPACRGRGRVRSSTWARSRGCAAVPGMVGYSTAKAGINGLTRTLARELGPMNIRVNSLVPGATLTERQRALWWTPESDRQFLDLQALKFRLGSQRRRPRGAVHRVRRGARLHRCEFRRGCRPDAKLRPGTAERDAEDAWRVSN